MHFSSLVGALLLGSAFAAPTKDHCPPGSNIPSPDKLGTLQTLKYNYLSAQNNGTAAVLVHDRLSSSKAAKRCAAIGEKLYPFETAPNANRTELVYQLDYLVYANDLPADEDVWVAGSGEECLAYSHSEKRAVSAECDLELPAICTSNVPPTRDVDRTVVASSKITVKSNEYTLTGYRDARSFRFLGVPFADPPVGDLRLAPPQEYTGPKKIEATTLADSCIQSVSSFGAPQNISEDCLYLNVFTPVLPERAGTVRKPVAVYFYGGAFTSGSASRIEYDGGNFASRNDVVVVTVNYRLGALGWLATGDLTTGSYGIRDQILALQWVNRNIAAFGGDPAHVTIFGQSAGGQSVIALLSSTSARGLFSAALVQSAPVDLPWYTREVYSTLVAPLVATAVGCGNATTTESTLLSCLRRIPATSFLDNSTAFQTATSAIAQSVGTSYLHVSQLLASIEPFMPMVSDSGPGVIDDQFHTLLASNTLPNRVPVLFSTTTDEAALYISRFVPDLGTSQSALNTLLNLAFPPALAESLINTTAFPTNNAQNDSVRITGASALTASEWTCPQAYLLRNGGTTTFPKLYEVEITTGHTQNNSTSIPAICSPNPIYNATCHSNDVLPAWGTLNSKTQFVHPYYDYADQLHSQLMNDIFGSFFRSYDPNPDVEFLRIRGRAYASSYAIFGDAGYEIKEYEEEGERLALLGMPPGQGKNPGDEEKCRVFEEYGFTFENAGFRG
ncbi:Carboxylesterase family-domain-containing protein [Aspergillus karnatakaensis]|uniref:putative cholinesterase n=1 Tax=Aspergillus karnatakaensis TaxID=1810916 RepID=UPI003CCDD269